ncbi:hypothetical protein SERLA73DRAFT_173271 [Serpula lacrymans var. lacrymans S7.3]|uniref:Uncharacterized protein n=2 Tax=Serpula lacrymans var. lacrymans TaxID=341189 RepID=F8QIJ6_SERL3|nr:uncharacterized protein SERLADRAFT_447522 [Serpula lacrymans var. lacrymans S7.9]EGN91878.1 hypothetical protein SERLA73DRAFT_173271 [Serpula lacrymans var. lacrymans S7.3]EGO26288.1 hypothetical protein SERLADRAFT_447522 [Serpula lacrymans var. lacrymans S7.9]
MLPRNGWSLSEVVRLEGNHHQTLACVHSCIHLDEALPKQGSQYDITPITVYKSSPVTYAELNLLGPSFGPSFSFRDSALTTERKKKEKTHTILRSTQSTLAPTSHLPTSDLVLFLISLNVTPSGQFVRWT